jgi:Glycosyl transferase family 2
MKLEGFPSAGFLLSVVSRFNKRNKQGKHWKIPNLVESAISWMAALLLAAYLGYSYLVSIASNCNARNDKGKIYKIPLVTVNRSSQGQHTSQSSAETLKEMQQVFKDITSKKQDQLDASSNQPPSANDPALLLYTDDDLVRIMRSSVPARRLAYLALQQQSWKETQQGQDDNSNSPLLEQLQRIWPRLLQLPSSSSSSINNDTDSKHTWPFQISVIVPAFGEQGTTIQANLQRALDACRQPHKVQLILVDAGHNTDLQKATQFQFDKKNEKLWGNLTRVAYSEGGGRGPTLNHGAHHAQGRILTFLHSDNILPDGWDQQILSAFDTTTNNNNNNKKRIIATAFSFKIDTSPGSQEYPPGLAAAQWLGTIRTRAFGAIYGDSVFSLRAQDFRYLGEYPHQALMEDYELMDLLRQRVAALDDETVAILPSETLISPRRWQTHGVPYVILFNWLCVFLYIQRGWSSEELFQLYYSKT